MSSCLLCCDPFEFFFGEFTDLRKSTEFRELVQEVCRSETAAVLQNLQRDQIAWQGEEIRRHASEISTLNNSHAADISAQRLEMQTLHREHVETVTALHAGYVSQIRTLHRDYTEKLRAKLAE